jgi:hypothetical protein
MDLFVSKEALNQAFGGIDLMTMTSSTNNNIPITSAMKGAMEAHANWLQFIQWIIQGLGVPMDDPETWSPDPSSGESDGLARAKEQNAEHYSAKCPIGCS